MNLKVTIAGTEFKSPVIAASGTFGLGREYNAFYDVSLLGGIATKGLTLEPREGNGGTRIAETPSGILNCVGLQNPGVEKFVADELPFLDKLGTVIIANVAGSTEEDYLKIAERFSRTSVDCLELNISCPNVKCGGVAFGVEPASVEHITRAVKAVCGAKPLIVKLTPNVARIADNAAAAENGGADAISLINTITGMAIDYKTRRPVLGNVTGGLSGPCVKPIALRMVYEAYRAVKIPIIGMGGIQTPEDVLEFMIAGASAVQVGSANIFDPMAAITIVKGLTKLLNSCKIDDVNEVIGSLII
ncbi:MAG: dihydroorotate dehydrogenase [Firmicutes bacterium]|nr:dihydroorotate dehydrogenase [Bacillota bacterium]